MRGSLLLALILVFPACDAGMNDVTQPETEVPLKVPVLPEISYKYSDAESPIPQHFFLSTAGSVLGSDNTPADNPITNAGATLGRVLFYDVRLSANNTVACASCHRQQFGFSDTARFSRGLHGEHPTRRTMALANARFYRSGRFFWDERAATLEAQVLQPIQNRIEMGMSLDSLVMKLRATSFYTPLFGAAFGTPNITSDRIARALAQFVRALVSAESRFDSVFMGNGPPDFSRLTQQEQDGFRIFEQSGCGNCHRTLAFFGDGARNTGLERDPVDAGAGLGRFKPPSLRNVAVRAPYMHDGRFSTLGQVVDFYDHGIVGNDWLDLRLRDADGDPRRLGLSPAERAALVAFLQTLTDQGFLHAPKFSDPFH
jgi:cytochrome c peroxidase